MYIIYIYRYITLPIAPTERVSSSHLHTEHFIVFRGLKNRVGQSRFVGRILGSAGVVPHHLVDPFCRRQGLCLTIL